ncbi:MAG TPA: class A beta-lactamase-related serine hydrolase [Desulfobacteraceae bacterium]|nr:class A beta-lactamase-related serine hydrolase [Desulfobacteraceae bacterium]
MVARHILRCWHKGGSVYTDLPVRLDELLREGMGGGVFPGAVLVVGTSGSVLYNNAVGFASVEPDRVPMKLDTIFDVASLTKPLATSLAVMKLVEIGTVNLGLTLGDLLPVDVPEDKNTIALRQLVSHSAGLPDWMPLYKKVEKGKTGRAKEQIRRLVLQIPLEYIPGTKALYSDLGYMLLEWVIEAVSGISLAEFLSRHFYAPLGLQRTFFQEVDKPLRYPLEEYAATEKCPWRGQVMRGFVHDENAYTMGGISGHAGLFSTAEEVFTLCATLLAHYHGKRSDLIGPSVVREFFTRQKDPEGSTWALGWDTPSPRGSAAGRYFSANSVGHLGFTGTSVWMDLDEDIIVVFLTNRVHPTRDNDKIKGFRPHLHDAVAHCFKRYSA